MAVTEWMDHSGDAPAELEAKAQLCADNSPDCAIEVMP